MQRHIVTCALGAAVLAISLAACSGDSATGPGLGITDNEINQGIASDAGDAVATSVDLMTAEDAAEGAASLTLAPGVDAAVTVTCTGPDAGGWFTCDKTTWRGLSLVRQVRYWDGTSYGLGFDPGTTDSVNHRLTLTGSFHPVWSPLRTIYVDRADTSTMIVNRAGSPVQHIWNRVGARQDSSTYVTANVRRAFHYTAFDTATAVTFDMPRSQYPWPMSGTVVHDVTVVFDASSDTKSYSKTIVRRVEVTFNGTENVTLQVGALTCSLDLGTHAVTGCH